MCVKFTLWLSTIYKLCALLCVREIIYTYLDIFTCTFATTGVNSSVMLDFYFNPSFILKGYWKTAEIWKKELHFTYCMMYHDDINHLFFSRTFSKVLFPQLWRPNTLMMTSFLCSCFRFSCTSACFTCTLASSLKKGYSFNNEDHSLSACFSALVHGEYLLNKVGF